ncbi:hypothetical protein [Actinobacillus porcinus]|uniref:hypothetical protein n=1 Tax=Actinobacillus porcinus TaxID=51048 RepID=UPI002354A640|nr:hypothetical protein [Actinobacillus porcinus]MCI5763130.1 hypothetical protein [Actinobacillus porcinus]MDY5421191.1 hypothetical protein [Actinobacillus porcinus]
MQAIYTIFEQGGLRTLTFTDEQLPDKTFTYETQHFMHLKDNTWINSKWVVFPAVSELNTLAAELITETKNPQMLVYQVELARVPYAQ